MKVLFIGDIFGEPGRRSVARAVPRLVAQRQIDIVIGNGENAAGGFGITPELAEELFDLGLAVITTGNHAWDKRKFSTTFPENHAYFGRLTIRMVYRVTGVWWSSRPVESSSAFSN